MKDDCNALYKSSAGFICMVGAYLEWLAKEIKK